MHVLGARSFFRDVTGRLTVCQIQKLSGSGEHLGCQLGQSEKRDTKLAWGGSCGDAPGGGAT